MDRPGKENSADLSETSRDIQDEKLFQRVQIKTRARHARIGEKKVGQSIRYRRFEREVGEPISKKRRELFFYREEKRDLRSATSSNRRYSMTLLVKSLNRRLNNRYSALIFPRCENGVSLLTRRRFDSRDCGITRRDVYRFERNNALLSRLLARVLRVSRDRYEYCLLYLISLATNTIILYFTPRLRSFIF